MPPKPLDAWLEKPQTRKRTRNISYNEDPESEKENEVTTKKRKAPASRLTAKKTAPAKTAATTITAKGRPVAKPKGAKGLDPKSARKLYQDGVKNMEAKHKELDRKVQKVIGKVYRPAITTDSYAKAVVKFVPDVKKVAEIDTVMAFNFLMAIADSSHSDLNIHAKMSGGGDSEEVFAKLDEVLVGLIEKREKPTERVTELPKVSHRWTREDAMVGEFKTGRPNKQQANQLYSERMAWEKERRAERRSRRENCSDYVSVALHDLKEERDYLDDYGLEGYLPRSIKALEDLQKQ